MAAMAARPWVEEEAEVPRALKAPVAKADRRSADGAETATVGVVRPPTEPRAARVERAPTEALVV
jgi:hypothetical protein